MMHVLFSPPHRVLAVQEDIAQGKTLSRQDRLRALTQNPREEFKGHDQTGMSAVLNNHLRQGEPGARDAFGQFAMLTARLS